MSIVLTRLILANWQSGVKFANANLLWASPQKRKLRFLFARLLHSSSLLMQFYGFWEILVSLRRILKFCALNVSRNVELVRIANRKRM